MVVVDHLNLSSVGCAAAGECLQGGLQRRRGIVGVMVLVMVRVVMAGEVVMVLVLVMVASVVVHGRGKKSGLA